MDNKTIIDNDNIFTVKARDVWQRLGLKKPFTSWFDQKIKSFNLEEKRDYILIYDVKPIKGNNGGGATRLKEYFITEELSEKISMMSLIMKGEYDIVIENKIKKDTKFTVNARTLWKKLGYKFSFATWFTLKIKQYDMKINRDYLVDIHIAGGQVSDSDLNNEFRMYFLTEDLAKKITRDSQTEKGEEYREDLQTVTDAFMNIKNNPERLLRNIIEADTNQAVQMFVSILNERVLTYQEKIENDRPKIEFVENIEKCKEGVHLGKFCKLLNPPIGRNNFFNLLREWDYLDDENIPYQKYIDSCIFEVKERTWKDSSGNTHISFTTLLTGKGQLYLEKKWREFAQDCILH